MAKSMQTTAAMAFVKLLLTIFNLIFWLTGLTLLVVGIAVLVGLRDYLDLSETDFTNMPYILIGTGLFMIAAGIIGCCAVVKNLAWFLQLFGIMIIVVFVALLAAGVFGFFYRTKLQDGFKAGLDKSMNGYNEETVDDVHVAIDRVQSTLQCCGVANYTTWLQSDSKWHQEHLEEGEVAPGSCCNVTVMPECDDTVVSVPIKNSNGTLIVYQKGCYTKVSSFLDNKLTMMSGVCIAFAFFQLLGVILSFCLAKLINANKYEMV
ncbi:tetraspanin-7-like [Apostichopus japonicus]|uniref:tetraspanin-7-like n=1 Tax=Stichopus japonicus TaxID=307972 RepID=UPI003AB41508